MQTNRWTARISCCCASVLMLVATTTFGTASDPVDQAFWDTIEHSTDPRMFEAYLQQFPGGHYAEQARTRIAALQSPDASAVVAAELAFWETIKNSTDPTVFEVYLSQFPQGHFTELAKIKLQTLQPPPSTTPEPPPESTAAVDEVEKLFWQTVSIDDQPVLYQAYLDRYPQGAYADLARTRLAAKQPITDKPTTNEAVTDQPVADKPVAEDKPAAPDNPVAAADNPVAEDKPVAPDNPPVAVADNPVAEDKPVAPEELVAAEDKPAAVATGTPAQIDDLFNRAQHAFAQNNLTTPEDDNAVSWAKQVLALDPADSRAQTLLSAIIDKYLGWADNNIRQGRASKAAGYINKVRNLANHASAEQEQALARLERDLRKKRARRNRPAPAPEPDEFIIAQEPEPTPPPPPKRAATARESLENIERNLSSPH